MEGRCCLRCCNAHDVGVDGSLTSTWNKRYYLRGAAKKKQRFFLGDLSQMWVGGVAYSQTRSKPLQTPPNHPENRIFRHEFHISFSQISQKPWDGWVGKQIWERFPKTFFI